MAEQSLTEVIARALLAVNRKQDDRLIIAPGSIKQTAAEVAYAIYASTWMDQVIEDAKRGNLDHE